MKKFLVGAVVASALALPLYSQAAGYVDLGIGQSHYNLDNNGFTSTTGDNNPTAYIISGGMDFTPVFGAELGYINLGSMDRTYSIGSTNVPTSIRTRTVYLAGTATAPLSDQFFLFGKLGIDTNRTRGTANAASFTVNDTVNRTGWLAGVGAAYHFTPALAGTVGYDYLGKIDDNNSHAGLWSVGLRLRF